MLWICIIKSVYVTFPGSTYDCLIQFIFNSIIQYSFRLVAPKGQNDYYCSVIYTITLLNSSKNAENGSVPSNENFIFTPNFLFYFLWCKSISSKQIICLSMTRLSKVFHSPSTKILFGQLRMCFKVTTT